MYRKIITTLMNIFKKKFKTRVNHFSKQYYTVDYCYYRFIPIWHSLKKWTTLFKTWDIGLHTYCEAERIAMKLKNIDDVKKYNEIEYYKYLNWKKYDDEYWKKNIPYKTKIINN